MSTMCVPPSSLLEHGLELIQAIIRAFQYDCAVLHCLELIQANSL